MKYALCIIVTMLLVTALGAADTGYDIGSFHPADLLQYSLAPRLTHNSSYSNYGKDTNLFTLGNALLLGGSITKEKPGYRYDLATSNSSSQSNISYYYPEDEDTESKTASSRMYSTNKAEYKQYFAPFFIGGGVVSSISYDTRRQTYYYDDGAATTHSTNKEVSHVLTGSIGLGRMYDCSEAYLAWYYFQELAENDCLSRAVSAADTEALAWAFYHIRSVNEINFSEKNRKKAALVLDCLQGLNCLKPEANTQAMAILLDVWMMSSNLTRHTGIQLEIKPMVDVSYSKERYHNPSNSEVTDTHRSYADNLTIRFDYEHPYLNVFQYSAVASAVGMINHQTNLNADVTWAYYPDNRSSISGGIDSEMIMYEYKEPTLRLAERSTEKYQRFTLRLYMRATYQLTYRLSANGEVGCGYLHQRKTGHHVYQSKGISSSLNLSYRLY